MKSLLTSRALPAGFITAWCSDIIPDGFLLCDGKEISRSKYSGLFDVIGTKFGNGNGTTTFNLPNLKGKTILGFDEADNDFNELGKIGGEKKHKLQTNELPKHNHSASVSISNNGSHTHSLSGSTNSTGEHKHGIHLTSNQKVQTSNGTLYVTTYTPGSTNDIYNDSAGSHAHAISGTTTSAGSHNHSASVSVSEAGNDEYHNNLQPYIALNYIIKY